MLIGLYENGIKFKEISTDERTSEALVVLLDEISSEYKIEKIIYANTPGSFMGLKVAYVILKTFSIVKECEFYAVSGFELNGNSPIRANKALCFVNENGEVKLKKAEPKGFLLPQNLEKLNLNSDTLPHYNIEAV